MVFKNQIESPIKKVVGKEFLDELKSTINESELTGTQKFLIKTDKFFYLLLILLNFFYILLVFIALNQYKKHANDNLSLFIKASEKIENVTFDKLFKNKYSTFLGGPQRGPGIPSDARWVKKTSYLMQGTFNGKDMEIANDQWRWTRSNGKQTQTYYAYTSSIVIRNNKLNKYPMFIENDSLINIKKTMVSAHANENTNNRTKLEKQSFSAPGFDKQFNIFGDPITSRKLFNAYELEKYMQINKITKRMKSKIQDDLYTVSFKPPTGFMVVSFVALRFSRESLAEKTIENINKDFEVFLNHLSYYSVLRKVQK